MLNSLKSRVATLVAEKSWWSDLLHLVSLSSFAIAAPLFDLLGRYPEFFAVRRSEPEDIFIVAGQLAFGPPIVLIGVALLCRLISSRLQRVVHLTVVTILSVVFYLPILKRAGGVLPVPVGLVSAAAVGFVFLLVYTKLNAFRRFLTLLSLTAILFPVLFFLRPSIRTIVFPSAQPSSAMNVSVENPVPVVLIIFDEFSVTSIMNENFDIDRVLFPNLGRLADMSYWFRDARTVTHKTIPAIASILTGQEITSPKSQIFPNNLFRLLGRTYDIRSFESVTHLCPKDLCTDLRVAGEFKGRRERLRELREDITIIFLHLAVPPPWDRKLPSISGTWSGFANPSEREGQDQTSKPRPSFKTKRGLVFETLLGSFQNRRKPTLYFLHVLLPHIPWIHYPSGRTYEKYRLEMESLVPGASPTRWVKDEDLVWLGFERYLLQVKFVDNLIGRLIDNLEEKGMLDETLIVMTADHGISFRPGETRREPGSGERRFDIENVPLFFKLPDQTEGRIVDKPRQTNDILPTIAQVVGVEIPWGVDGQSLFGGQRPHLRQEPKKLKYSMVRRIMERYGEYPEPEARLYSSSFGSPWVGREAEDLTNGESEELSVALETPPRSQRTFLVKEGGVLPGLVVGRIEGNSDSLTSSSEVVIAVNGVIAAVTELYENPYSDKRKFSVVLPEEIFRPGKNTAQFFVVDRVDSDRPLKRLKGRSAAARSR